MATYKAAKSQDFTRNISLASGDQGALANGQTRTLIIQTDGFAALYADLVSERVLGVTISRGPTEEGPWVEVDAFSSSGSTGSPDAIALGCKGSWVKIELANASGSSADQLQFRPRLSKAVLS